MNSFKKILVPIDGSQTSERAVDEAISLAQLADSDIYLVYVAALKAGLNQNVIDITKMPPEVIETLKEEGNKVLQDVVNRLPESLKDKTITLCETGIPKKVILEKEEEYNIDVIIMGTRGLNAAESVLIGSLGQYMVEHAKCPVMIVK